MTFNNWLSHIDKDAKEKRDRRIFDLWLACYTQEEIAEEVGCDQMTVARFAKGFTQNGESSDLSKTEEKDSTSTPAKLSDAQLSASQFNDGTDDNGNPKWKPPL